MIKLLKIYIFGFSHKIFSFEKAEFVCLFVCLKCTLEEKYESGTNFELTTNCEHSLSHKGSHLVCEKRRWVSVSVLMLTCDLSRKMLIIKGCSSHGREHPS